MKRYTAIELLQQGKKATKDEFKKCQFIYLNNKNIVTFVDRQNCNVEYICNDFFKPVWYEYQECSYPIYMLAINKPKHQQFIVKFTSLKKGIVVATNYDSDHGINCKSNHWIPHTDETFWKKVTNPNELCDKDLVEVWDNNQKCTRGIKFYDAKYRGTFHSDGYRTGMAYDNYKKIMPWNYPDWVTQEIIDSLED